MARSAGVWERGPEGLSYHLVGYMRIACESIREDVAVIFELQRGIDCESVFIEGGRESTQYMRGLVTDWRAKAGAGPVRLRH